MLDINQKKVLINVVNDASRGICIAKAKEFNYLAQIAQELALEIQNEEKLNAEEAANADPAED